MRLLVKLMILLLLLSCTEKSQLSLSPFYMGSKHLLIALKPMEDRANTPASAKTAVSLTSAIIDRLRGIDHLTLTTKQEQFVVNMKLLQHDQLPHVPSELAMSIQLEIVDMRTLPHEVILHEVISYNTLLEAPLTENHLISWEDEFFRISPLGLSHAKLSREIASRIEDYIALARKG